MNADSTQDRQRLNSEMRAGIAKRMTQVIAQFALQAAVLFLSSGRLDWVWAWVLIGLYLVGMSINAFVMLRHSPETIARRAEAEGMRDWDKVIGGLWAVMYFLFTHLIAGLDTRFGWTRMALGLHLTGVVAFILGFALFSWAMISNAYFSTVVRVQKEREHAVCTSGPYRFVRHPGYTGAVIHSLALPVILGSLWALIPGGLAALLMIVRTALEDRTLREELDGYQEYAAQVRYRLLPGIW